MDDAQVTADADGQYRFSAIGLAEGTNTLRVPVSNEVGTTICSVVVELDSAPPVAVLSDPLSGQLTHTDLGYIDVQWTDPGRAGLDTATFGIDDVTLTGVSIDRVEILEGATTGDVTIRYWYNDDGQSLPAGSITVTLLAGAVSDLAGNASAQATASFTVASAEPVDVTDLVITFWGKATPSSRVVLRPVALEGVVQSADAVPLVAVFRDDEPVDAVFGDAPLVQ